MLPLGTLGRRFAEAVEAVDSQPIEGLHATNANNVLSIACGIIISWLRLRYSNKRYLLESNVRPARVVRKVDDFLSARHRLSAFLLWQSMALLGLRYHTRNIV
jgi:ABC-type phosphate/phosphonate transport system permease subunit